MDKTRPFGQKCERENLKLPILEMEVFSVFYSTLLCLPPLIFPCAGGMLELNLGLGAVLQCKSADLTTL
jgi:hypothetical protein